MESVETAQLLKSLAQQQGFFLQGICPAVQPPHYRQFCDWLEAGYAGTMDYLPARKDAYSHPRGILDGAKSVMMLGINYYSTAQHSDPKKVSDPNDGLITSGKTAKYVHSGVDYHDVVHKKLKHLVKLLREQYPDWKVRGVVDTAPLLERDFARLSGLGWVGKNTMLINKRRGSFFFLAALIFNAELPPDLPHEKDHCGTCTSCLDACPTDAFTKPYVLDATRCISYWTIESKELAPEDLRSKFDGWFFGCDICQDVCPWNRHTTNTDVESLEADPAFEDLDLEQFFKMDEDEFRARFRKTPFWRSRLEGMMRNAAVVWGNLKDRSRIDTLKKGLTHESQVVRETCEWAISEIRNNPKNLA